MSVAGIPDIDTWIADLGSLEAVISINGDIARKEGEVELRITDLSLESGLGSNGELIGGIGWKGIGHGDEGEIWILPGYGL